MKPGLLDINDCNLQLWHADQHLQSPGYALLSDGEFRFGATALRAARLKPRDINTRFWSQLSTEALQPGLGTARHTADLVHAHLNTLYTEARQPDELVLSVPGSMQREQLSLLLGIVASCPFNAVGLVHRSTALASLYGTGETTFHLEIQLHQSLLSKLKTDGTETALQRSIVLPGVGLLQLQERLVEILADAFLKQTRFDPRRQAATEQQLYDALPGVLAALRVATETNIEINGYLAHIDGRDVEQIARPLYDHIAKHFSAGSLLADPLAGLLPGLDKAFAGVTLLQTNDIQRAVESQRDVLVQHTEQLDFITRLPQRSGTAVQPAGPSPTATTAVPPTPRATHLLQDNRARPLTGQGTDLATGWSVQLTDGGWQLQGGGAPVQVNGSSASAGQQLGLGDTIIVGDEAPITLIDVKG